MNPKTIITELRRINAWRRGDETVGQPAPGHFGDVLDAAAILIEQTDARCIEREERIEQMGASWDKTKADLARVTAERQNWKEWAEEARAMFHKQIDAAAVMKTRAEQAEQRNAELESNCRDLRVAYEQNASQCVQLNRELAMKPDTVEWLNGVTIQRQRAEQAEAHIADLVAALEKIAKSDPLANGRYAAHNAAQALARARLSRPNAADEARR